MKGRDCRRKTSTWRYIVYTEIVQVLLRLFRYRETWKIGKVETMGTMSKNRAEEILGLSGTYDAKKLRDEYRKLAAKNHPDAVAARGGDVDAADAKMKEINSANSYLSVLVKANGTLTVGIEPGMENGSGYTVYGGKTAQPTTPSNKTYSTKQGTAASTGQSRWGAYTAAGQDWAKAWQGGVGKAAYTAAGQNAAAATQASADKTAATQTAPAAKEPKNYDTFVTVLNIIGKVINLIPLRLIIAWLLFSNTYSFMVSHNIWSNFLNWNLSVAQFMDVNPFIFIPLGLLAMLACVIELITGLASKIIKALLNGLLDIINVAVQTATSK